MNNETKNSKICVSPIYVGCSPINHISCFEQANVSACTRSQSLPLLRPQPRSPDRYLGPYGKILLGVDFVFAKAILLTSGAGRPKLFGQITKYDSKVLAHASQGYA
jgi:hypothetical protein